MWKCNIWSSFSIDWILQSRNQGFLGNLELRDYFSPVWYFFFSLSEVTKVWITEKSKVSQQIKTKGVGWVAVATLNIHIAVIISLVFSNVAMWHSVPSIAKGIKYIVNFVWLSLGWLGFSSFFLNIRMKIQNLTFWIAGNLGCNWMSSFLFLPSFFKVPNTYRIGTPWMSCKLFFVKVAKLNTISSPVMWLRHS